MLCHNGMIREIKSIKPIKLAPFGAKFQHQAINNRDSLISFERVL